MRGKWSGKNDRDSDLEQVNTSARSGKAMHIIACILYCEVGNQFLEASVTRPFQGDCRGKRISEIPTITEVDCNLSQTVVELVVVLDRMTQQPNRSEESPMNALT